VKELFCKYIEYFVSWWSEVANCGLTN